MMVIIGILLLLILVSTQGGRDALSSFIGLCIVLAVIALALAIVIGTGAFLLDLAGII